MTIPGTTTEKRSVAFQGIVSLFAVTELSQRTEGKVAEKRTVTYFAVFCFVWGETLGENYTFQVLENIKHQEKFSARMSQQFRIFHNEDLHDLCRTSRIVA
jgi:hypothetical protein